MASLTAAAPTTPTSPSQPHRRASAVGSPLLSAFGHHRKQSTAGLAVAPSPLTLTLDVGSASTTPRTSQDHVQTSNLDAGQQRRPVRRTSVSNSDSSGPRPAANSAIEPSPMSVTGIGSPSSPQQQPAKARRRPSTSSGAGANVPTIDAMVGSSPSQTLNIGNFPSPGSPATMPAESKASAAMPGSVIGSGVPAIASSANKGMANGLVLAVEGKHSQSADQTVAPALHSPSSTQQLQPHIAGGAERSLRPSTVGRRTSIAGTAKIEVAPLAISVMHGVADQANDKTPESPRINAPPTHGRPTRRASVIVRTSTGADMPLSPVLGAASETLTDTTAPSKSMRKHSGLRIGSISGPDSCPEGSPKSATIPAPAPQLPHPISTTLAPSTVSGSTPASAVSPSGSPASATSFNPAAYVLADSTGAAEPQFHRVKAPLRRQSIAGKPHLHGLHAEEEAAATLDLLLPGSTAAGASGVHPVPPTLPGAGQCAAKPASLSDGNASPSLGRQPSAHNSTESPLLGRHRRGSILGHSPLKMTVTTDLDSPADAHARDASLASSTTSRAPNSSANDFTPSMARSRRASTTAQSSPLRPTSSQAGASLAEDQTEGSATLPVFESPAPIARRKSIMQSSSGDTPSNIRRGSIISGRTMEAAMAAATASAAGSAVGSGSSTPTGGTGAVMGTVSGISGTSGGSSSSSASDVKNVLEKHRKTMLRLDTNTNLKIKKDGCAPSPMSARGKGPAIPLPLQTNSESIDASAVISGQLMGGSAGECVGGSTTGGGQLLQRGNTLRQQDRGLSSPSVASFSAMLPLPGIHGGKAQPSPSGLGLLAVTFASSSSPSGSDDDHSVNIGKRSSPDLLSTSSRARPHSALRGLTCGTPKDRSVLLKWIRLSRSILRSMRVTRSVFKNARVTAWHGERRLSPETRKDDPLSKSSTTLGRCAPSDTNFRSDEQRIAKMLELLDTPVETRSKDTVQLLEVMLSSMPSFARHSREVRIGIASHGTRLRCAANKVIVRQGHRATATYFVLSGTCEEERVSLVGDGSAGLIRRMEVALGSCIGDCGVHEGKERRLATVVATSMTQLLCIDRDVLRGLINTDARAQMPQRLDILAGVPALVNVPPELLHTIARHCKALRFEAGSIILQARGDRSHLYFMTSGHCKAIRSVPFRRLLKSPPGSHVSLKPLEPGVTVLNPSLEESTFLTLHAGDISAGDYFPRLSLTRSEYHEFKAQLVPSSKLVLLLEALLAHGPRQFEDAFMSSENNLVFAKPADSLKIVDMTIPQEAEDAMIALDMEVTASSRVDCLQIGRVDLIKILTEEALVNFVNPRYESVAGIALYELQEAYLERLSGDADGPVREHAPKKGSATGNREMEDCQIASPTQVAGGGGLTTGLVGSLVGDGDAEVKKAPRHRQSRRGVSGTTSGH